MNESLANLIFAAGLVQWSVLIASALVPVRLNWTTTLRELPRLVRQLYWVYGGYVVLAIVALGALCVFNAEELASGGLLARCVCGYIATFWGIRLSLQLVLDAKPFLTTWWLKSGYHLLTVVFIGLTTVFTWAALRS